MDQMDPRGKDAPSAERRHEQTISKHHLMGGKVTRMEKRMFHAIISWEKKVKQDLGTVHPNPNLLDVAPTNPKTS